MKYKGWEITKPKEATFYHARKPYSNGVNYYMERRTLTAIREAIDKR